MVLKKKNQSKNKEKEKTQILSVSELSFLCTALLHNVFYQSMNFKVDIFTVFKLRPIKKFKVKISKQTLTKGSNSKKGGI